MLLYFDAHWATKVGNGNAIIDIERVAMLLLLGSKSSKNYKVTTFNDILTTLYTLPPYYSNLSNANRVVNMQGENEQLKKTKTKKQTKGINYSYKLAFAGKPGCWKSVDHLVEHLNLLLKRPHTGGQSLKTLETLSLSLDLFQELDRTFSAQLDLEHSGSHRRPNNHDDVVKLAQAIAAPAPTPALNVPVFEDLATQGWENRDWVRKRLEKKEEAMIDEGDEDGPEFAPEDNSFNESD